MHLSIFPISCKVNRTNYEVHTCLVSEPDDSVRRRIVFRRVCKLAVGKLDLRIVFNFIEEHDSPVLQKPSMHSRDTSLTNNLKRTRNWSSGSWWRTWRNNDSASCARPALAPITAMSSGFAAELWHVSNTRPPRSSYWSAHSVQRAAAPLRPVSADCIVITCTTGPVSCCNTGRRRNRWFP